MPIPIIAVIVNLIRTLATTLIEKMVQVTVRALVDRMVGEIIQKLSRRRPDHERLTFDNFRDTIGQEVEEDDEFMASFEEDEEEDLFTFSEEDEQEFFGDEFEIPQPLDNFNSTISVEEEEDLDNLSEVVEPISNIPSLSFEFNHDE